jgi:uncharacterized membrane protein YgcG
MTDISSLVVKAKAAIVLNALNAAFGKMAEAMKKDIGVEMEILQSYLSKYEVADELRKLVKDKTSAPPDDIKPLLDPNKAMNDIITPGNYQKLEDYLNQLTPTDYDPPLPAEFTSASGTKVKLKPGKVNEDPRRTAKYVEPGPVDVMKNTEVIKWIVNNSFIYGFLMYGDNALYYAGEDNIKSKIENSPTRDADFKKLVGFFMKDAGLLGQLTATPDSLLSGNGNVKVPVGSFEIDLNKYPFAYAKGAVSSNGFYLGTTDGTLPLNPGQPKKLIFRLLGNPVTPGTLNAWLQMDAAAKKDGVNNVLTQITSAVRAPLSPYTDYSNGTWPIKWSDGQTTNASTQEKMRIDYSYYGGKGNKDVINYKKGGKSLAGVPFRDDDTGTLPQIAARGVNRWKSERYVELILGNVYHFVHLVGMPGYSPHGTGTSIDISVERNKVKSGNYYWLIKNSYKYGVIRTLASEDWHFEYMPSRAQYGPYAGMEEVRKPGITDLKTIQKAGTAPVKKNWFHSGTDNSNKDIFDPDTFKYVKLLQEPKWINIPKDLQNSPLLTIKDGGSQAGNSGGSGGSGSGGSGSGGSGSGGSGSGGGTNFNTSSQTIKSITVPGGTGWGNVDLSKLAIDQAVGDKILKNRIRGSASTIWIPAGATNKPIDVIVFYPGVSSDASQRPRYNALEDVPSGSSRTGPQSGRYYMPPILGRAVPDWFDKYVIVVPDTNKSDWSTIKQDIEAQLSAKKLTKKSLNIGLFSGSGYLLASAGKELINNKLAKVIMLADTLDNFHVSTKPLVTTAKNNGVQMFASYRYGNWGSKYAKAAVVDIPEEIGKVFGAGHMITTDGSNYTYLGAKGGSGDHFLQYAGLLFKFKSQIENAIG